MKTVEIAALFSIEAIDLELLSLNPQPNLHRHHRTNSEKAKKNQAGSF
jgi:hypothetical protein